jgi:preprotein translocase subunit Sec61beta
MADKTPIRTVFNAENVATGLAEFQSGETVPLNHGGTGVALSIGSAGQVLKVNSGASALEFGVVEAIVNIDNATNLTSATLATGDQILISDGGTEGRATLAQIDTLFSGTSKTLTNKTLTSPVINTGVSGTAILDEDNMASDSATQLSTQQSIKAYVDTEIGNVSTTSIATGNSNVTVVDSGTGNVTIEVDGTDRITTVAATTTTATGHSLVMGAASSTVGGQIKFLEGTNNGTNGVTLQGAASTADVTVILPAAADTLVGKATTDTFTNKSIDLATNTITGSLAEFNAALQSESFVSLTGSETLTNKTLTTPVLTTPIANAGIQLKNAATSAGFIEFFEDSDNGTNKVTLIGPASTADVTVTLPAAADTLVGKATTDTFTNKSIDLATNTITGSLAEFNSALQSESFVSLTGSETLTNKTLTAPVINTGTFGTTAQVGISTSTAKDIFNAGLSVKNAATSAGFIEFFEDSDNGTNKVTLIGPANTADVTVTLPAVAGTVITTANSDAATTTTDASDVDFILIDDGGTLKKITTSNLGIVDNTGFDTSSFIDPPGGDGNFDLAKEREQTGSAESGLTANTVVDAFGRRTASTPDIYDLMDPEFQNLAVDYGSVA